MKPEIQTLAIHILKEWWKTQVIKYSSANYFTLYYFSFLLGVKEKVFKKSACKVAVRKKNNYIKTYKAMI